ncbi:hypothetical protein LIER_40556 [Lithospermum erythrorhizon]|uniref:Uncharacterized protein n=1 Tax=Lithospermum erythrorhizon TaxID=34254 RepID=A0AAV3QWA4_LITER
MGGEGKTRVSRNKMVVRALTSPLKQHHYLPLSNLDLLLPPEYFSIFLCYKNPLNEGNDYYTFSNAITILKDALSICLVSFYIFAGEMSQNDDEPHVICNNHGVDFVEAFADVNFRDLDFHNSHHSVDGVLIPERKHGVLAIQVSPIL